MSTVCPSFEKYSIVCVSTCGKEKLTAIVLLRFARRVKQFCARILRDERLEKIAIGEGNFMLDLADEWRWSGWWVMC